ncbi:hypothetical protein HDU83_003720 [Entophlyctis luteolus]|nr:hypothetical protein HDU83_003720 [Entophlyctis luteolus]KAJ3380523.1 hypothetical protein HDU84_005765 [Entophlyctis sp. JEL0112]
MDWWRQQLEEQKQQREREKTRNAEHRAEEDLKIQVNRLRREKELARIAAERAAAVQLAAENQQTVFLATKNELDARQHDITMAAKYRRGDLFGRQEDAIDAQRDREDKRERAAMALAEARKEHEKSLSTTNVTVEEDLITENGKVVGARKKIHRVREATTDADVEALMASIAGELSLVNATELRLPEPTQPLRLENSDGGDML